MHRMRTDEKSIVQLEIARSGFSFDISSHPAKIGHIDKAKPPVRVGRKAMDLWIFPIESACGFCPVGDFQTESVAKKL